MKTVFLGIIGGVVLFLLSQMVLPFPYGLVVGLAVAGLIIRYAIKHSTLDRDSLLRYRRADPINEKEKAQNDEALRILEKKYIEEKISKEEYLKQKKEFEDIEYNPRKCKVCGSEEFDFVAKRVEELGEPISDEGNYRCKKCGANES